MNDFNQLSDFKLKLGYWIVTHKISIKRLFLFFLFAFDVLLITFSIYSLVQFYSVGRVKFESTIFQLGFYNVDFDTYHKRNSPQNIRLLELDAVSLGKNKYNFIAKIKNPNLTDWLIEEIEYYFHYGNMDTKVKKSFVLPGEEKYLGDFNIESSVQVLKPELRISHIKWKRIKKAEVKDFTKKMKDFTNFEIVNKEFLTGSSLGLAQEGPLTVVKFTVKNNTIYDYYDVAFFILTYNGPVITGANYIVLSDFFSGETRTAEVRWHNSIPQPSQIVIDTEVNLLDPTVIMSKENIGLPK